MKQLFPLLLALLLLAGCSAPQQNTPINSVKPIDKATLTSVEVAMKQDPVLAGCVIDVRAENDMVILKGDVPTEEAKTKAEMLAKRTPGVARISNQLVVKPMENPAP